MSKTMTKTKLSDDIATYTGVDRKTVSKILDGLAHVAGVELSQGGKFAIPGVVNLSRIDKPATAEHEGLHPITKTPIVVRAKAASSKVRAVASRKLIAGTQTDDSE